MKCDRNIKDVRQSVFKEKLVLIINENYELMNCLSCGRDTRAKHGYCNRCIKKGRWGHQMPSEMKDRPTLQIDGDNIMQLDYLSTDFAFFDD